MLISETFTNGYSAPIENLMPTNETFIDTSLRSSCYHTCLKYSEFKDWSEQANSALSGTSWLSIIYPSDETIRYCTTLGKAVNQGLNRIDVCINGFCQSCCEEIEDGTRQGYDVVKQGLKRTDKGIFAFCQSCYEMIEYGTTLGNDSVIRVANWFGKGISNFWKPFVEIKHLPETNICFSKFFINFLNFIKPFGLIEIYRSIQNFVPYVQAFDNQMANIIDYFEFIPYRSTAFFFANPFDESVQRPLFMLTDRWFWDARLGVRNVLQWSFFIYDWLSIEYFGDLPTNPFPNILSIRMELPSIFENVMFDFYNIHVYNGLLNVLFVIAEKNIFNLPILAY